MADALEYDRSDDSARLRAVLDAAVDGVITIDERGTVESANPAAEKLFGYSSSEMIGHNVNMLMPSPYREEHDGYLANYSRTGERKIIGIGRVVDGRRKDGATFPVYLAVSEVSFGHRRIFTGFVHDLTNLKRAEEQATQLGRILEDSLNEIFFFDSESLRFVFVNRGALANIGYTAEELFRMTPVNIKPEFNQQQFAEFIEPLNSGKCSDLQFDTVHKRKDSTRYDVHIRLQKSKWQGRDVFVAFVLDVTERKRVQDELAALNAELEQRVEQRTRELRETQAQLIRKEKLAALGQLSAGVAHEIRNPLGVIKNSVYYLKMIAEQLSEDAQECVEEIDQEVENANGIVSELLDFTRDPPSHAEVFFLEKAIGNAIRAAKVPAEVRLTVARIDPAIQLRADQGQIERVITNLISNAWQAMSGGGDLSIEPKLQGDHVVIDVRDTGVGIPAENLINVFEPLFTTKAKGIGLGLAVSRRYAQRNGGSLTVESSVGKGTVFHFSVPLNGAAR